MSSLEAVRVTTRQAEPSLWSSDFEAEASIVLSYATVNVGCVYGARTCHSENVNVIRSFPQHVLPDVSQFDQGPDRLSSAVDLKDRSEKCFHEIECMSAGDREQVCARRCAIDVVIFGR